jgi:hypothetical protein
MFTMSVFFISLSRMYVIRNPLRTKKKDTAVSPLKKIGQSGRAESP